MERGILFLTFLALAQAKLIDLSCNHIKSFVDAHNMKRLSLAKGEVPNQPAASEMKFMMWDEELADKAAYWASKNKFAHNPDRKIGSNRFETGENIYSFSTTDHTFNINPSMAVDSWFDEYKDYSYGPLKNSDFDGSTGVQIGHYTQVAWSDTIYVGCAMSEKIEGGWKKFIVVCNYGPGGNYLGQTPYKAGQASRGLLCGTQDCSRPYGRCR